MSVIVVATVVPAAGQRDGVIAALEATISRVHAEEPGTELYALHEGKEKLVMIEKYASQEAFAAHGQGGALAELSAALKGKLERDLDVQVLTPHPAGAQEKGEL